MQQIRQSFKQMAKELTEEKRKFKSAELIARELCKRIKHIREVHSLNQTEFADKIEVGRSTVSNWENEDTANMPSFHNLHRILEAFPSISPRYLLTGQGYVYAAQEKEAKSAADRDLQMLDIMITWKNSVELLNQFLEQHIQKP